MEIRNKKKTLNPLMKNKKWRLSKKKRFLITSSRVYGSSYFVGVPKLPLVIRVGSAQT